MLDEVGLYNFHPLNLKCDLLPFACPHFAWLRSSVWLASSVGDLRTPGFNVCFSQMQLAPLRRGAGRSAGDGGHRDAADDVRQDPRGGPAPGRV
jgi:hypothetical protein